MRLVCLPSSMPSYLSKPSKTGIPLKNRCKVTIFFPHTILNPSFFVIFNSFRDFENNYKENKSTNSHKLPQPSSAHINSLYI